MSDYDNIPFRDVNFAPRDIEVVEKPDGTILLSPRLKLELREPHLPAYLNRHAQASIGSINGVSRVAGRPENGRGGMRSWMQAQRVPAVSTRIAGLVDLFSSPSKPGTNSSIPTDFSVASLLIECC